ncbi:MAG TPA: hypothetical protein VNQ14_09870, partial [Woeseiaceae bacterium]|nr:hypothetical protein [Woeseiaceae bacterium]
SERVVGRALSPASRRLFLLVDPAAWPPAMHHGRKREFQPDFREKVPEGEYPFLPPVSVR